MYIHIYIPSYIYINYHSGFCIKSIEKNFFLYTTEEIILIKTLLNIVKTSYIIVNICKLLFFLILV